MQVTDKTGNENHDLRNMQAEQRDREAASNEHTENANDNGADSGLTQQAQSSKQMVSVSRLPHCPHVTKFVRSLSQEQNLAMPTGAALPIIGYSSFGHIPGD
jgi:hypothetical protein